MTKVKFVRGGDASETFYLDTIRVQYEHLVELFGEPDPGDQYKTDAEWTLTFSNGVVATIYNWKDGPAYLGNDALVSRVDQITDWHVGGRKREALWLVQQVISGR